MKPLGYVLYEGPSCFDLVPIVVLMTLNSKNFKTGAMLQTWILRQDIPPLTAVTENLDYSICGNCVHRLQRTCYVNVARAPQAVWKAWKRGRYEVLPENFESILRGKHLRLGSYGDPAAVPVEVWAPLVEAAAGHTGYTHFWRTNPQLAQYCMASVDTPREQEQANALGFRTFRTKQAHHVRKKNEAHCPAAEEMGKKLSCATCLACCGNLKGFNGNVTINLHGPNGAKLRV